MENIIAVGICTDKANVLVSTHTVLEGNRPSFVEPVGVCFVVSILTPKE